jgi:HK97 family phage prohead protease
MDRLEFAATYEVEGDTLSGIVHVFGTKATKGGITHQFDPKAFEDSMAGAIAFYGHDQNKPLARPELIIDGGQLRYRMTLGHQSYADDLRENISAGLMDKMSFGVIPEQWQDRRTAEGPVRYHTKSRLFDISPVSIPAFEGTNALLHSRGIESRASQLVRARARVQEGIR